MNAIVQCTDRHILKINEISVAGGDELSEML